MGSGGNVAIRFVGVATGGEADSVVSGVEFDPESASLKRMPTGFDELNANPKTMLTASTPSVCQMRWRREELLDAAIEGCDGDWLEGTSGLGAFIDDLRCL